MIREINSNLHLRYTGVSNVNDSCMDLSDLGISLVGFDKLFRNLIKITKVNGDISIRATSFREGSVVVDILIKLQEVSEQAPFDSFSDLLDYLKIVNEVAWQEADSFFHEITSTSKTIYDYLSKHPVELTMFSVVLVKLIEFARRNKNQPCLECDDLPKRVAVELNKLIQKKRGFKLALKPLIEDKASSIEVSTERTFLRPAIINQDNFHEYLGEEEKILPHLENGNVCALHGEVRSLKSTRRDSFTFKYIYKNKTYNLDLLPPDGVSTKKYTDYYLEKVVVEAEVVRASLYKKPKLKLNSIDFLQPKLFNENIEENRTMA
jgi:excinuclease UvrABC ATPase subunit